MSPSERRSRYLAHLRPIVPMQARGIVQQVSGMVIDGRGLQAPLGDIYPRYAGTAIKTEVVDCTAKHVLLMPHGDTHSIHPVSMIIHRGEKATVHIALAMRGRVLDGAGELIDGKGPLPEGHSYPVYTVSPRPVAQRSAAMPPKLGICAMEEVLTCGQGLQIVLCARAESDIQGLIEAIAHHAQADVNVLAFIGAQQPRLQDGMERCLSTEGRKKTVRVASAAEETALMR